MSSWSVCSNTEKLLFYWCRYCCRHNSSLPDNSTAALAGTVSCAPLWDKKSMWGGFIRMGLVKAVVNSCYIRWAPPPHPLLPRRGTARSVPDVSWEERRKNLEPHQGTVQSFLKARISVSHTSRPALNMRCFSWEALILKLSIFSSVQEIWSEQVAACKLKREAPVFPSCPALHDWFSFLSFSTDLRIYDYGIWPVDPPRQSELHRSVA